MLETSSLHYESVRTQAGQIWRNYSDRKFRPAVNLPLLEELIRISIPDEVRESVGKGKKRSSSPTSTENRRSKRTKTSIESVNNNNEPEGSGVDASASDWKRLYPSLIPQNSFERLQLDGANTYTFDKVPVWIHTLDIQYNDLMKSQQSYERNELDSTWVEEEKRFCLLLNELRESSAPTTVPMGDIDLREHNSRLVGVSDLLSKSRGRTDDWLLLIPSMAQDIDLEDYDLSSSSSADLLTACLVLSRVHKVSIKTRLSLVVNPPEVDMAYTGVPFRLQAEVVVSIRTPAIFKPLGHKETKKQVQEVEDAKRRLLQYVYGRGQNEQSMVNISYFYSVLNAAPELPSVMAADAMQPNLLNPTLLPFQRRSVAWLLEREGMTVTAEGDIVPSVSPNNFSFWDTVTEGNHSSFFNRLSGAWEVEQPPQSSPPLGGILAEEPGLGKTLETIALILLNPAPPSRNPSMTRWDPETKLDVKAIKSSLIVTPPALASQWMDEIAAHAPTLKVLVYDGWSKVRVPITSSRMEAERVQDLNGKRKEMEKEKGKSKLKRRSKKATTSKAEKKTKQMSKQDQLEIDMTLDDEGNGLKWCEYVHQFDVVITTYQALRSDFNVARAAPVRPRREDVVYANVERPRSPLVMVEWNRVIMDEVQMVGGGKTEDMVSLIPRLSSFAVSGTPARAQIADMFHVLKFLRVDDIVGSPRLWSRLIKPGYAHEFASFFNTFAIRTTKSSIQKELTIPQQTRYLVPIELGKVERHVYDQTLEGVLLDLGLDARGVAASDGWEVDGALLRSSIRRLRGICTHPQVGQLQRRGDNYKRGALKSMDSVLQNMRDQNWKNVIEDGKSKVQNMIRFAQLQQHNEDDPERYQVACRTLESAEKEIRALIDETTTLAAEHAAQGDILKKEAAALRQDRASALASTPSNDTGKGKGRQMSEDPDSDADGDDEDPEDKGLPKTSAGNEHRTKTRVLKQRLRECRLILHRIKFLQGDVYHIFGKEHSADEDAAYSAAEDLRRELLKATEDEANRAMASLAIDATRKRFDEDELTIELPYLDQFGIRSAILVEDVNTFIEEVLNEQGDLLWEWRTCITDLLTQRLNPGDEADGQEYQRNLDNQGEAEAYLQAYTALLADRREALINERTLLAAHDVREKKLRHTKAAIKAANAAFDAGLSIPEDLEIQPEHEVMYKELSERRKELLSRLGGKAIKSFLIELSAVATRITRDTDPEKHIVAEAITSVRQLIASQGTLHDKLDADLILIRRAFNERILYFRQLQEISDSVAEVTWEEDTLAEAIQACTTEKAELEGRINTNRARHRYLVNLAHAKDANDLDEDENTCILCRCDFTRGFITQCAHVFCEGCMKAWLARKEGKTCPVCRVAIDPDTVQRFTVNAAEDEPPLQPINGEPAPKSYRQIVYNKIGPTFYEAIQKIESYGDFGSKIQTLVRHLLYLQVNDPGAKSIVFSAWADSLHIVEWALNNNGIRCLRIDQNSKGESAAKKFRTDPDILVLLLHGERENAGLNVTCACRVFLLESVVHHSFELQAIARIDRMGQTRPTEVYCYYAEDTVERHILDLAARQGLSLYTKENSAGTLDVSSFSQENEKGVVDSPVKKLQKGDFIFKIEDMLAILFPHMYEDLEFLVPQDGALEDSEMVDLPPPPARTSRTSGSGAKFRSFTNAVAGPSSRPRV